MDVVELKSELDHIAPGFAAYLESPENRFETNSLHGLCAALSSFVREGTTQAAVWRRIAELANHSVGGGHADLDNAVCTCLLENFADASHPLCGLLKGPALAYWREWCEGA